MVPRERLEEPSSKSTRKHLKQAYSSKFIVQGMWGLNKNTPSALVPKVLVFLKDFNVFKTNYAEIATFKYMRLWICSSVELYDTTPIL